MQFQVRDFTERLKEKADLVLCLDVLFHLSTDSKHQEAIDTICNNFQKLAIVSTWNEGIVEQYKGRFAAHTFFRPFKIPADIQVQRVTIPMCPSKTLFVLTR